MASISIIKCSTEIRHFHLKHSQINVMKPMINISIYTCLFLSSRFNKLPGVISSSGFCHSQTSVLANNAESIIATY